MIGIFFSFFILPVAVINSVPFEGYGILLVDLYEQPLSLPLTNQESLDDVTVTRLEEQEDPTATEIAINVDDQELESLAEMIDLLGIISRGYVNPMIGLEMQLYKVDNGFRQNLVSMNMIVDPSYEEAEENSEEDKSEEINSDDSAEKLSVDMHHNYNPHDRLINPYYGANSARFLPINLYRPFLAQPQQQPNMFPYDSEKQATDYWSMMRNQENLEIPAHPIYPTEYASMNAHISPTSYPTLEDALRMYDLDVKNQKSEEKLGLYKEPLEDVQPDFREETQGIFSSLGNFFKKLF